MTSFFRPRGVARFTGPADAYQQAEDAAAAEELAVMHQSALLDLTDRRNQAIAVIEAALPTAGADARNVLLDIRNALIKPEPIDWEQYLRPSVPVIPGRTS